MILIALALLTLALFFAGLALLWVGHRLCERLNYGRWW